MLKKKGLLIRNPREKLYQVWGYYILSRYVNFFIHTQNVSENVPLSVHFSLRWEG